MKPAQGAFAYGAPQFAVCRMAVCLPAQSNRESGALQSVQELCRLLFDRRYQEEQTGSVATNFALWLAESLAGLLAPLSQTEVFFAADEPADLALLDCGPLSRMSFLQRRFTGLSAFEEAVAAAFEGLASGRVEKAVVAAVGDREGCAIALSRFSEAKHPLAVMTQGAVSELSAQTDWRTVSLLVGADAAGYSSREDLPWCQWDTSPIALASSHATRAALSVAICALSLHQKLLPGTAGGSVGDFAGGGRFYVSRQSRPWISPVSPLEDWLPRRAAAAWQGCSGKAVLLLHEFDQGLAPDHVSYLDRNSELFIFQAQDSHSLALQLQECSRRAGRVDTDRLCDLSWSVNLRPGSGGFRAAIIAESCASFFERLDLLCRHILDSPQAPISFQNAAAGGIYYNAGDAGRAPLAFVLPGLGAAYPDMLLELCTHFPEVRQVFDYVDRLAFKDREQVLPSSLIFPLEASNPWGASSVASLAAMDSAVVLVLLAEYALYTLLKNLNVLPDALVGCSTGEFAVLTMSGSVNILEAAQTFYRLSTAVSRSVPAHELEKLRTLVVSAGAQRLATLMSENPEPIYLGAEMTDSYVIVSGRDTAIEAFSKILRTCNISFFPLPTAIPYHTPLVAGKVSAGQQDVRALPMRLPAIDMWSCSFADRYPHDVSAIREISTNLFEHPILFKSTIERMYAAGIRTFVEVGPKGALVPLVSEILKDRPHCALATNVFGRPAVGQLQHLLASLIMLGFDLNLAYLYRHNAPRTVLAEDADASSSLLPSQRRTSRSEAPEAFLEPPAGSSLEQVLQSFMESLTYMHEQVLALQQESMKAYLASGASAFEHSGAADEPDPLGGDVLELPGLAAGVTVALVRGRDLPDGSAALNLLVEDLLDEIDRQHWLDLQRKSEKRAKDWLLGRLAAKAAVRRELKELCGLQVAFRDIAVRNGADGAPVFVWSASERQRISVSISHCKDVAVALATRLWPGAGIDLEAVEDREEGFGVLAFTARERQLLQALVLSGANKTVVQTIMWSVRESTAKAQGITAQGSLRAATVAGLDLRSGQAELIGRNGREIGAKFWQVDDMVLSLALLGSFVNAPVQV